ncbi:MAG: hypothetical protein ABH887_01335 [bacterium]
MSVKKILSYVLGVIGILLIPNSLGVSFCYVFSLYDNQCSPEIIRLFLIIGLVFIGVAIFLFLWDEIERFIKK